MTLAAATPAGATSAGAADPIVLRVDGVSKRFGSVLANDAVSLTLARGEVLALLGENGAGKSTLVSMLFGQYVPDAGRIEAFGRALPPGDTRAALAAGIGMVHQHFTLADNLTVLDNVLVGLEPLARWRSARAAVRARLLDNARAYGLDVEPDARVADLSVGERQRVEILKALVRGARILILDEPTAVLTPQESESLFATLSRFVADGLSMIFISHKLDEVLRVSDRIAVLRGGRLVTTLPAAGASTAQLARAMIGRDLDARFDPGAGPDASSRTGAPVRAEAEDAGGRAVPTVAAAAATAASANANANADANADANDAAPAPVLRISGVRIGSADRPLLAGLDLTVRAGQVLAIAGVAGNGQQALADLLCGVIAADQGEVTLQGRPMPASARAWIRAGVARIPEDRVHLGVIGDATLDENAIVEHYREPSALRGGPIGRRLGLLDRRAMRERAQRIVDDFDVRHGGLHRPIRSLSGGNIQKFILGRELDRPGAEPPCLILANQPTWGLDVGAVDDIHGRLRAARERGAAIVLISEELDEIFALADEVAVLFKGRLGAPRPVSAWTPESIGLAMAGQH
ncbi:MAG: ABC transporter ATP-binding protein [Burkholderiaceae bacterium]